MNITKYEQLIRHLYTVAQTGVQEGVDRYVPLMTWGEAGIGKSETVKRASKQLGIGFIDLRLGQLEVGDLIGLPRPEEVYPSPYDQGDEAPVDHRNARFSRQQLLWHIRQNHPDKVKADAAKVLKTALNLVEKDYSYMVDFRTVYATPDWFPPPHTHGILFLDELNRSQDDVRQAIFQLILDREMHGLGLPPGWILVSANNPDTDTEQAYDVKNIDDPAFLSRFLHIALQPTADEWLEYARTRNVDPSILAVISAHPAMLSRQTDDDDITPNLQPTPRSWMMLNSILPLPHDILIEVAMGLIGSTAATAWKQIQLSPERPVTGQEVLTDYTRHRPRLLSFMEHTNEEGHRSPRLDMIHMTFEDVTTILSRMHKADQRPTAEQYKQLEKMLIDNATDIEDGGLGNFDMAVNYLRGWAMKFGPLAGVLLKNKAITDMLRKVMAEQGQMALVQGATTSGGGGPTTFTQFGVEAWSDPRYASMRL